jgi:hydroxymethylglutaryl-CoA lyase/(R)-citramalyl-CoA lyase
VATGRRVTLYEVGPRDGLQNEPEVLDVDTRAELVRRLADTGIPAIEVASFVDSRRVPQMADAEEVVAAVGALPSAVRAGLALNERGYDRLVTAGLEEVRFSFGITEEFNRRNQGAGVEESLGAARETVVRAKGDGLRASVILSVAFGCPFEGEVDRGHVADVAARVAESEPDTIVLADTIGVASPAAVRSLTERTAVLGPSVGGHFHNTRNTGYANAVAALEAGATVLDASVGGLGGCPFAPNATGNIATEDLVYLLEREGVATGVDLDGLIEVSGWMADTLGRPLEGQLYRAGAFPRH